MATANLRFRIIGDDDASGTFLKVAAAAEVASNAMGSWTRIAVNSASAVPVFAAAAASLIELSTSAAAGAGALGIFGLSVVGIGKDMVDAQTKITAAQKKLAGLTAGTAEYKAALLDLRSQQQDFNKQFGPAAKGLRDVRTAFSQFKFATSKVTTNVMAKAFELLTHVLPKLVPVSNAAGKAVGGLIDDLSKWTKSPAFAGLLKWFRTSGPAAITHFGHVIGNVLDGLGGILSNFVGPGDKAAKSLDKLTKRFAEWGHSKGVSDSVDKFLRYVSDNGPKVSAVFASLAQILPKLAVAFGQLGSLQLGAISMFLQLLAGLPQGVFDAVVKGLFGIVVATKALNIALSINVLLTGMQTALVAIQDATIGTRIALAALFVTEKVGAVATAAMTAAQWALNAAMTANPIGIVVVALAALGVGLVIAYKKSETFRNIVNGAFRGVQSVVGAVVGFISSHWGAVLSLLTGATSTAVGAVVKGFSRVVSAIKTLGTWGKWLWNSIFQPVLHFIVSGVASLLSMWAAMLHALSHVPGFGWVGALADKLDSAAGKARGLADGINKIPSVKNVDINIYTHHIGVHGQNNPDLAGLGGAGGSGASGGAGSGGAARAGASIGQNLMDGIVRGIADRRLSVQSALDGVTALIQKMGEKIANLESVKKGFQSTFSANSVFGADLSTTTTDALGNSVTTPPVASGLIAFQKAQAEQARQLLHDVRNATKMGLSKALVRELESQGASGAAALHALATGSRAQIRQLNRLDKQTSDSLRSAGMQAGNYVRGGSINDDIARARQQDRRLEQLHHDLKDLENTIRKGQTVIVKIGDDAIIKAIHRYEQRKGKKTTATSP